jgi:alpha-tubulin suppressor-like RCC1 family protein
MTPSPVGGLRPLVGILLCVLAAPAAGDPSPAEDPVAQLALGDEHACARTRSGQVRCWGRNLSGQLGDGTREDRAIASVPVALDQIVQIAAFGAKTCAVRRDGSVFCWGATGALTGGADGRRPTFGMSSADEFDDLTPHRVTRLPGAVEIAIGGEHLCARTSHGAVWCWGANDEGQLGSGDLQPRMAPERVAGLEHAVQLALGVAHSCALLSHGAVACWGANEGGQLGDSTLDRRLRPTSIRDFAEVAQVAADGGSTCARLRNGTVRCWGWNQAGQLGDGTRKNHAIPKAVYGLAAVTDLSLGGSHGCAVSGGAVRCWGDNARGQLGDRALEGSLVPVLVAAVPAQALGAAGQLTGGHTCTVSLAGQAICWGQNDRGQLGHGTFGEPGAPHAIAWPRAQRPTPVSRADELHRPALY